MLNFLRMDFYRMLHSKTTWVFLGVIAVAAICSTMFTSYITSESFLNAPILDQSAEVVSPGSDTATGDSEGSDGAVGSGSTSEKTKTPGSVGSVLAYLGNSFLGAGLLAMFLMLYTALFLINEFESGFVKNVFTANTNRLVFFTSKAVFMLAVAGLFSIFAFTVAYIAALITGLKLDPVPFGDVVIWFLLVLLVLFAFEMLAALAIWSTRSKVLGILVAVFVGAGVVYSIVGMLFQLFPPLSNVIDYSLTGCLLSLSKATDIAGPLGIPRILGIVVVFLGVFATASILTLKKKDV